MNEIHIFSKFESSTNSRMNGFTTVIKSQIGVLHVTTPDGKANTFVPDGPVNDSVVDFALASRRWRLDGMASTSFTWFSVIASGTGMFSAWNYENTENIELIRFGKNPIEWMLSTTISFFTWWTSCKLRSANICVSNSSLSRTIFSGNPTVIRFSAFLIKPSLYSWT